ncbi:hypothetical protein CkaCkLH20_13135 [Colletotrichum karsti]|uniref:Mitochondrial transcription factor 1 n=1 Tax=Colletotrichum karsti TaxID=1095194 RepID=A0A9P6HS99_9PEZI|nr:uncharacterized protein CkaCkLH20_13135 [Colletotrichum karsti]KAF9869418.1 hypothetical protein CkaCkLH20_13135 [Colletotrichum karsti]
MEAEAKLPNSDGRRVNIVDEKLCDDILSYIGPTLRRHEGCDLVDINPGAGLWSRKLNEFLKPRSHLLMEPDETLYGPFLEPILQKPGTKLLPKSGIVWRDLGEALRHIENQTPRPRGPDITPERNDTLLVTANLAFFPKKPYGNFDSAAQLVLFQLVSSIRLGQLFQKYGLVRMLIWTGADDWQSYVSRNLQTRKKGALEAEVSCEWFANVASPEPSEGDVWYVRDKWIDIDSTIATLKRMEEQGLELPEARRKKSTKEAEPYKDSGETFAGQEDVNIARPFLEELEKLEKLVTEGTLTRKSDRKSWSRLLLLRARKAYGRLPDSTKTVLHDLERIREFRRSHPESKSEIDKMESEWNEKVDSLKKNEKGEFRMVRDNMHVFHQSPPVMLWDRRPYEPINVDPKEFFPNVGCALLDIQPKAMHRLHREIGPGSSRAGDMFELLQRTLMASSMEPMSKALDRIWPGAADGVLPNCPSLRDPEQGGTEGSGHAELCPRVLNEKQWTEILEAFMAWPFHPSYIELIARFADEIPGDTNDSGAGGSSFSADAALNL